MMRLRPLLPTAVLIGLAVLLIAMITIVRVISAGAGFLVERQVVLLVWLVGLLGASVVFAWVVRGALRRDQPSGSGLFLMVLTVLVMVSPLAMMFLQHPAP
jgi:hypothetical protein